MVIGETWSLWKGGWSCSSCGDFGVCARACPAASRNREILSIISRPPIINGDKPATRGKRNETGNML